MEASPSPLSSPALQAALSRPARFLAATVLHEPPPRGWATPNRVLREEPAYRLREFSMATDPMPPSGGASSGETPWGGTPVLVVPPEVNQSYIVDFNPDQSLIRAIGRGGFSRVAALE